MRKYFMLWDDQTPSVWRVPGRTSLHLVSRGQVSAAYSIHQMTWRRHYGLKQADGRPHEAGSCDPRQPLPQASSVPIRIHLTRQLGSVTEDGSMERPKVVSLL